MRKKKSEGHFLKHLEHFVNVYMPDARGLSKNTVISYKATFRILILFFYEKKGVPASDITFEMLTANAISEFLDWIETERNCSVLTRNQRLAALYSFSEYAQNRDFDAASCFRMAVIKIPMKKAKGKEQCHLVSVLEKEFPSIDENGREFFFYIYYYSVKFFLKEIYCTLVLYNSEK